MAVDWSKRLRDCRGQLVRHMKMNVAFVSDMMKNDVISASDRGQLDKVTNVQFCLTYGQIFACLIFRLS